LLFSEAYFKINVVSTLIQLISSIGFQVRGAHLKKLRRAEGGAKNFGVFRVKNHDFTPKSLYSTLWGVAGVIVVYRRVLVGNNCVSCT
jgi:hypothetical protein